MGEAGGGVCEVPGLPLHREAGGDGAGPGGGQGDGLGVGRGRQGQPGPLPLTGGRGVSCQVRCQVRCQVKCWMSWMFLVDAMLPGGAGACSGRLQLGVHAAHIPAAGCQLRR